MTTITASAPFGAVVILRTVNAFSKATENLKEWNDARITRRQLSKLSDRQLDDIGLTRINLF